MAVIEAPPADHSTTFARLSRALASRRAMLRSIATFILVFSLWELIGRYGTSGRLFFVPFSAVVQSAIEMSRSGELQVHIIASFSAVAYGMAIAIVVGVAIGILSGASQTFREYTDGLFAAIYATPLVAVAPLLILWFGIGISSKVAVVVLMAVFPILINTAAGIRATDIDLIEAARCFGARKGQLVTKVLVPSAMPFVITGIRLAIGRAVVGVVVAELFGARAGLGFLIFTAGQTFDTASLFVGVLFLAMAGMTLTLGVKLIEERIGKWRRPPLDD